MSRCESVCVNVTVCPCVCAFACHMQPKWCHSRREIGALRDGGKRNGRTKTNEKMAQGEEGQRGEVALMIVTETEQCAGQRGARAQKVSGRGSARGGFVEGTPVSLR